jgi:hypothetical protein
MFHFWQNYLYPFLNSPFLLSLVTVFVGSVAFLIYKKQHTDEKKEAAGAIFNEILSAENKLKGIRDRFFAVQYPTLEGSLIFSNTDNWDRYRYLFIQDLTGDEWNIVDNFYSNCRTYDEAVSLNNSYFHENAKHVFNSIHTHYKSVIDSFFKNNPSKTKLPIKQVNQSKSYVSAFLGNIYDAGGTYNPQKPVDDARVALVALDTSISLSSAGQNIKKLAKI